MIRPLVVAIAIMSAPSICRAQTVYTPNTPAQLPPMRVEVVDSTSFRDIETGSVYRLYGVDSCRAGQLATLGRQHWPCAAVATGWLVNATLGKWVSCNILREQDAVRLARCSSSEHSDLAADMLKEGLAVTLPPDRNELVRAYGAAQEQAKKTYKGLWSSQFTMPWEASAPKPAQVSNE